MFFSPVVSNFRTYYTEIYIFDATFCTHFIIDRHLENNMDRKIRILIRIMYSKKSKSFLYNTFLGFFYRSSTAYIKSN